MENNVCIPIHLDAYALSPASCGVDKTETDAPTGQRSEFPLSKVAPFTQPDYTALRLNSNFIQHDVLDHADFHLSQPATRNPRVADIGLDPSNNLKLRRLGVHLHWSLPRLFRGATASGKPVSSKDDIKDITQPIFRQIPNRWLVTRHLTNPQDAPQGFPVYESWVIESDLVQNVTDMSPSVDLESDVSPFVDYDGDSTHLDVLNAQTEKFLGCKKTLDEWQRPETRDHLKQGLTVMSSSNPLFADYALHNCNVLSMIDNFSYPRNENDTNPRDATSSYLSKAHCNYYVIGWHNEKERDPFFQPFDQFDKSNATTRLKELLLKLSSQEAGPDGKFKDSKDTTRCLVHGAIYGVQYDFHGTPSTVLAEDAAKNFVPSGKRPIGLSDPARMEPLSVGSTPLDAILTFFQAHDAPGDTENDKAFGTNGKRVAHEIMELSQLLYATADQYDSRVQAQDLIMQQNFSKTDGGSRWTLAKQPPQPLFDKDGRLIVSDAQSALDTLNEKQTQLDVVNRKLDAVKWELFAEWFRFKSEFVPNPGSSENSALIAAFSKRVSALKDQLNGTITPPTVGLIAFHTTLLAEVDTWKAKIDAKISSKDPFSTRTDPTLCIAGLESGWPADAMEVLQVRLDKELNKDIGPISAVLDAIPVTADNDLATTASKILAECLRRESRSDPGDVGITGFQDWANRNPFVPLYIEWEAMYYHIGGETWSVEPWDVQLRPSPVGHTQHQIRYVPGTTLLASDPKANNARNQKDYRVLSGRTLILPQPRFNLQDVILQVITNKSIKLPDNLDADFADEIQQIRNKSNKLPDNLHADFADEIQQIRFISAPLSGLTNHLLTRYEGAHVKPTVRKPGEHTVALTCAGDADLNDIGLDSKTLALIDGNSALSPYGALMAFSMDDGQYPYNPFKPVTQGQMVFTKLNIIDKFGQAICLPPSTKRKRVSAAPPDARIYPCLSDYLTPDVVRSDSTLTTGTLNTVFATPEQSVDGQWPFCPFIQLTPSINQDARINAAFLVQDTAGTTYSPWREANDYESPIWGWIVINYADNALQFFLGDGTFYQEIRRGGVNGTQVSAKWLPYGQDTGPTATNAATHQLSGLLNQLSPQVDKDAPQVDRDGTYLQAFASMIDAAIQNMPFPPSSYAGYANAIVGKPLALVNVGWSIELAEPPIKPQFSSLDKRPDDWKDALLRYDFKLKVGDAERNYDGVVGYFDSTKNSQPSATAPAPPPSTAWDRLYTYFPQPHKDIIELTTDEYIKLNPYYIDPEPETTPVMTDARNSAYTVTSLLVDPYTPIHGYSPILPTKTVTVPPWAVQTAMDKMHAFFHLGPCLMTDDVPTTYAAASATNADGSPACAVKLPVSGRKGTWTWLQPYSEDGVDGDGNELPAQYATMAVQEDLSKVKFAPAPYTFVEGYLQLMGQLTSATAVTH